MGSIFKSGKGYSIRFGYYVDGARKQKRISGFDTKAAAKKALDEVERLMSSSEENPFKDSRMRFEELCNEFRMHHFGKLAKKTELYYDTLMRNHIEPFFNDDVVDEITPLKIEKFYSCCAKKEVSANTLHHIHITLRLILNKAVKWGVITKNPITEVDTPKKKKVKMEIVPHHEIPTFLQAFKDSPIGFHVSLALYLGLRKGEICGLRIEDFDFTNKTISINRTVQRFKGEIYIKPCKTIESHRTLYMSQDVERIIKERIDWVNKNRLRFGPVYNFENIGYLSVFENGRFQTDSYVINRFKKDLLKFNLKNIRFHDLRHSCASWLLHNNANMKTIQGILGHSNYSTTANTYSHVVDDDVKMAMSGLSIAK